MKTWIQSIVDAVEARRANAKALKEMCSGDPNSYGSGSADGEIEALTMVLGRIWGPICKKCRATLDIEDGDPFNDPESCGNCGCEAWTGADWMDEDEDELEDRDPNKGGQ